MSDQGAPTDANSTPCSDGPCNEAKEHLWVYIDGELSADDCQRIKAHIEACPPCEQLFRNERTVKDVVARACGCESAPQDLRGRVIARLKQLRIETCGGRTSVTATSIEISEIANADDPH